MKKIKYLLSAIPAALFATGAHADISVSGSGSAAFTDAGGNSKSHMGGGVSFAMSTTTDAGVTISGSAGTSNDADSAASSSGATGITNLSFGFANGSISIGQDIGVADGVGKVGEIVGYADTANGMVAFSDSTGLTDDEGDGISASTSIGDMTLAVAYVWDGGGTANVDGATTTSQSVSLSMPVGAGSLTIANASDDASGVNMNETGVAYSMPLAGGTFALGFTGTDGDTASLEGESMSAKYATTLGGASVTLGYTGHDVNSKTGAETNVIVSSSLGGGASIFAEIASRSGNSAAAATATTDRTVVAVGTSVSF